MDGSRALSNGTMTAKDRFSGYGGTAEGYDRMLKDEVILAYIDSGASDRQRRPRRFGRLSDRTSCVVMFFASFEQFALPRRAEQGE